MTKYAGKLLICTVVVTGVALLARFGTAADAPGAMVPEGDYPRLVERSNKIIQESLTGEVNARAAEKARVAAVMIAAYAQNTSGNASQRATLRDAALKVAKAIEDEKYDEAKKLAEGLASVKADPAAKTEPIEMMDKVVYIEEVMGQFKLGRAGGLEIERDLLKLGSAGLRTKAIPDADMNEKLVLDAYQTAVAARLSKEYKPDMKPADWAKYCDQMEKAALDLAGAVKAKDSKAAYTALRSLNNSCTDCHDIFR